MLKSWSLEVWVLYVDADGHFQAPWKMVGREGEASRFLGGRSLLTPCCSGGEKGKRREGEYNIHVSYVKIKPSL